MNLVVLTGDGPEHRYVVNRLCAAVDVAAVVVEKGLDLDARQRTRQLWRRYSVPQLGSRLARSAYLRMIGDAAARAEQYDEVFGAEGRELRHPELVTEVTTVNREPAHELVAALDPARLLVYGTGIVGDRMLARSRATPLNMHTGISPWYRGSACAFWPIHNGEPEMCGATVHEITAVVDGGAIFATARAGLEPGDGIHAVFARCVVAGAEIYAETAQRLAGGDPVDEEPQDLTVGTEYRASMRGLRAEIGARRRLAAGLLDDLDRPPEPYGA